MEDSEYIFQRDNRRVQGELRIERILDAICGVKMNDGRALECVMPADECRRIALAVLGEIERLRSALEPFCQADWYALGNGKFQGIVSGATLDEAKRATGIR